MSNEGRGGARGTGLDALVDADGVAPEGIVYVALSVAGDDGVRERIWRESDPVGALVRAYDDHEAQAVVAVEGYETKTPKVVAVCWWEDVSIQVARILVRRAQAKLRDGVPRL